METCQSVLRQTLADDRNSFADSFCAIIGFSCLFFSKKIAAILILGMISMQTLVLLLTIPFVEAKLKRENTSHDKN